MKRFALLALVPLLLLAALPAAHAADEPGYAPATRDLVRRLLDTQDREAQADLARDIVSLAPPVDQVAAWLAEGRTYAADAPTGWIERTVEGSDGVERPWLLFVPPSYTPATRHRLVVDLHGGVSRPQVIPHAGLKEMESFFWAEHAAEHGYLVAVPSGQAGAVWWDAVGTRNVLDIIRAVKHDYNVDENQVFATGFSDGASGSFYLALTHPTPFAGFIPLNGHVAVTQVGGHQAHLLPLLGRPVYAVNTENDSLYPSASVKPFVDALKALGAPLVWRDIPEFRHDPSYLPDERAAIWAWAEPIRRTPHPKRVVWQGVAGAPSRVDWLDHVVVKEGVGAAEFADVNPALPPGRVLIGVTIDQAFEGPGVRIEGVSDDSLAEALGLEAGDVLVGLDDTEIEGMQALRSVLGAKAHGDWIEVRYLRDGQVHRAVGSFPPAQPRPGLRREKPWGALRIHAGENVFDVKARNVQAFDLYLADGLVDLSKPVVVEVNGTRVHDAIVAPDLATLLTLAARDEDRTAIYKARLHIEIPAE